MTLPRRNVSKFFTCIICCKEFYLQKPEEHYEVCYAEKIANLLSEFDKEISKLKQKCDNKLKVFKTIINLSDLCQKCEHYSLPSKIDIEDCHHVKILK